MLAMNCWQVVFMSGMGVNARQSFRKPFRVAVERHHMGWIGEIGDTWELRTFGPSGLDLGPLPSAYSLGIWSVCPDIPHNLFSECKLHRVPVFGSCQVELEFEFLIGKTGFHEEHNI